MSTEGALSDIGSVVVDESFPGVDMALRRGRHIDRDDTEWYAFLLDAQPLLESFYRRFGCELIHKSDGYFYLLPTSDGLGKRQLSAPEMLVGQALALLYLDPRTVQSGGVVTRDDVLGHMASVMTTDGLVQAFNPKRRRLDERVAQETVRGKVTEGLRKLANGGFIEQLEGDSIRLRSALMRFADPVRTSESPAQALAKLVARGEVMLEANDAGAAPTAQADPEMHAESESTPAIDSTSDAAENVPAEEPVFEDYPEFDVLDEPSSKGEATSDTVGKPAIPGEDHE